VKYLEQLDTTATAVVDLAERTASLADHRRRDHRSLSVDTRTTLAATAVRLRATADRLDALAVARKDRAIYGYFDGAPVWGPAT
jgi:hypothetical protein